MNRDEFMEAMKEKNIGTGLHYRAVHFILIIASIWFQPGGFSKCRKCVRTHCELATYFQP